jgi:hypothetical protein
VGKTKIDYCDNIFENGKVKIFVSTFLLLPTNDPHILKTEVQVEFGLLAHVAGELDGVDLASRVLAYNCRKIKL